MYLSSFLELAFVFTTSPFCSDLKIILAFLDKFFSIIETNFVSLYDLLPPILKIL